MKIFCLPRYKIIIILFLSCIILFSCNKEDAPLLVGNYKGDFTILEEVGDTLLPTDTCYTYRRIRLNASKEFITFNWIVGDPVNTFSTRSFDLVFSEKNKIIVKLNGLLKNKKDTSISKPLVICQPKELISPLVGDYIGNNTDNLKDTFTVSIKYWFGPRYSWWSDGAYSINNLPKIIRIRHKILMETSVLKLRELYPQLDIKIYFLTRLQIYPHKELKGMQVCVGGSEIL